MKNFKLVRTILYSILVVSLLFNMLFGFMIIKNNNIEYKVKFWPHKRPITLSEMNIEHEDQFSYGIGGHQLSLTINLIGNVSGYIGRRPYIKSVHVSESLQSDENGEYVLLSLYPIIDVSNDNTYQLESIPFSYQFSYNLNTYQWGNNRYVIRCLDHDRTIELFNQK